MLPVITSGMPLVDGPLLDQVRDGIRTIDRLVDIERRHLPGDPMLTRAAVFELTRCGHLVAEELHIRPLSGATHFAKLG